MNLQLPPGADVKESGLIAEFGVSRTPIREALIRLASDNLVILLPNHGARVVSLEADEAPETMEALELYYRAVSRLSATRRRPEDLLELERLSRAFADAVQLKDANRMSEASLHFHLVIAVSCGNRHIAKFYEKLLASGFRIMRIIFAYDVSNTTKRRSRHYALAADQHMHMIAALRSGDAERADQVARENMEFWRKWMFMFLNENLTEDIDLSFVSPDMVDPKGRNVPSRSISRHP